MFSKKIIYGRRYAHIGKEAEDTCAAAYRLAEQLAREYASPDVRAVAGRYIEATAPAIQAYITALFMWYNASYVSAKVARSSGEKAGLKALRTYVTAAERIAGPRTALLLQTAMSQFGTQPRQVEYIFAELMLEDFNVALSDGAAFTERHYQFFRFCMEDKGVMVLKIKFPSHDEDLVNLVVELGGYSL